MWSSPTWHSTAWQQTGCPLKHGKLSTPCCMYVSALGLSLKRLCDVAGIALRPSHCWSFGVILGCVATSCVCCTRCVAGNCFSLQREHEAAVRLFQRALQLDPHMPYAGRCPCTPHCTRASPPDMLHGGVPGDGATATYGCCNQH